MPPHREAVSVGGNYKTKQLKTQNQKAKAYVLTFFACLTIMGCDNLSKKESVFKEFDFSYGNTFETCFSIKFTQGDTVFIREHWTSEYDTKLKSKTNYVSIIRHTDRITLDSLIKSINFSKFDTVYYEDYADGRQYKYYIKNQHIDKTVYVHSYHNVPSELDSLTHWIYNLKSNLKLKKIDTTLSFGSVGKFLPPPPPPPPTVFRKTSKQKNNCHQHIIANIVG